MKVLGLVIEANPLHLGHKYFIDKAKEIVKPDITIAIITTNFSMRGDVSVIDKFTKTKLLLELGINIILELPFKAAVASSDYFAYNAIKALTRFKITNLAFGCEADSLEELKNLQTIKNSLDDSSLVKEYLDNGYSYSTSIFKAIKEMTDDTKIIESISLPNNTLAISYLNALDKLNYNVNINIIKRIDNNYYDTSVSSKIASATSLREKLINGEDITEFTPFKVDYIDLIKANNMLYKLFQYNFLVNYPDKTYRFLGMREGIENRLAHCININNYSNYITYAQTKRYTITRIKRIMLHVLLESLDEEQLYDYLRIIGLDKQGKSYLSKLDKETKKDLITNINIVDNDLLASELRATNIYGIICDINDLNMEEYKLPIIKDEVKENA